MKIKCNHCKYEWEYKGESKYYVTCPNCLYKVNIKKEVKNDRNKKEI